MGKPQMVWTQDLYHNLGNISSWFWWRLNSAQVVKTSVNVTSNSPLQDFTHPNDRASSSYEKDKALNSCLKSEHHPWSLISVLAGFQQELVVFKDERLIKDKLQYHKLLIAKLIGWNVTRSARSSSVKHVTTAGQICRLYSACEYGLVCWKTYWEVDAFEFWSACLPPKLKNLKSP